MVDWTNFMKVSVRLLLTIFTFLSPTTGVFVVVRLLCSQEHSSVGHGIITIIGLHLVSNNINKYKYNNCKVELLSVANGLVSLNVHFDFFLVY